jgi:cytochrome b
MTSIPHVPTAAAPAGRAARTTAAGGGRRVTDAPTRLFHALFAASFFGAYLTSEGEAWRALHITLGYTMAGLLAFRLVYGLVGPRQARLVLWWRRAAAVRHAFVGWMPVAVLGVMALVVPLVLTGYATYNDWGDTLGGDWIEDVHAFIGNTVLALVLVHVALIVLWSVQRRRNLARQMWNGRSPTPGAGPDLVTHDRRGWAALMLVAVLAFGAWQWQQFPNGLLPGAEGNGHAAGPGGNGSRGDPDGERVGPHAEARNGRDGRDDDD